MVKGGHAAVFLDRDGVLNETEVRNGKPYAPRRLAEFRIYADALAALTLLKSNGFRLIVVTNQPDIGNGLVDPAVINAMHDLLRDALPVEEIMVCPHAQNDNCACRKPRPGMIMQAAEKLQLNLSDSWLIGDRWSDTGAAAAAGVRSVFIDRGYSETPGSIDCDAMVPGILDAVRHILGRTSEGARRWPL